MFKKFKIYHLVMFIMICSITVSLILSAVFVQSKIVNINLDKIKHDILRVTNVVVNDKEIVENIETGNQSAIQINTKKLAEASDVDFIVVMDRKAIRLSHPEEKVIGQPFSNQGEAKRALQGEAYYSEQVGVLGKGFRYFKPIYNEQQDIIGAVCVGMTDKNISSLKKMLSSPLQLGWLVGIFVGILMTLIMSRQLKKVTLGLEPAELALKYIEKDLINDEVNEGIVALDTDGIVILVNSSFKKMFPNSYYEQSTKRFLNPEVQEVIFQDVFKNPRKIQDELVYFTGLELLVSVSPIYRDSRFIGAVATIKDQSEFKQLMFELSGTEKYVGALRAQTHEFMNKLHIISGLIELERYNEVGEYVADIQKNHQVEIGHLNLRIKNPLVLGFLIGKINEGNEKHIHISLSENSDIPDLVLGATGYSFLQVLGNIIDNGMEAIISTEQADGRILVELTCDEDNQTIFATVVNNGPAISESIKEQLFNENISTKGKSNGYGLYICKGIVESQNGSINFSSSEYETVFQVEFPLGGLIDDK